MSETIDFTDRDDIEGETEAAPPELYAANLVEWAIDRYASDLFVSDAEHCVVVSVRRLGKIEVVRRLARNYGRRLQGHLRVLAGADAGETIRPSDGRAVMHIPSGRDIDMRLSSIPTLFGQDIAIRLFDPGDGSRSLETLGLDRHEMSAVDHLLDLSAGLVLLTGPTASGKSSTLYAMLERMNDGTRKIHTLEDPIEHALENVIQTQVNLRAGLDFADLLSVVLRHSPDVIMIGEIRDARTAATAVRAGASGQLVLATVHAKSAAEAVDSMLHYQTNPKFLASALIGVINQRLVRKLCSNCRQPLELDQPVPMPEHIAYRLDGRQPTLYKPVGCQECFKDGFQDLTCMPEIMVVNRELSEAISHGASSYELEALARQHGMLTLGDSAMIRALSGVTTPQEANRQVFSSELAELSGLYH
ncbi:MAG: Flp pilus assembly complex ATPase component TadA [Pirellulaceae bacterium]|nr:Flp pilus assembly complex ATPase component TadA [Pirellulaceae bacterium]